MHCKEFRALEKAVRQQQITDSDYQRWEAHLAACEHCLDYYLATSLPASTLTPAESDCLVRQVLQGTTGVACAASEALLEQQLSEQLTEEQAGLLHLHIDDCDACGRLAMELSGLEETLTGLQTAAPPAGFSDRVLRSTTGPQQDGVSLQSAWRRLLEGLLRRPRFSLEAAFVLTMVFTLTVGLPAGLLSTPAGAESGSLQQSLVSVRASLGAELQRLGPLVQDNLQAMETMGNQIVATGWRGLNLPQEPGPWLEQTVKNWINRVGDVFENP